MKRINKRRLNGISHIVTPEEKAAVMVELEKQYPGYLYENQKLITIVLILTGVRLLYSVFYLYMSYLYELGMLQGVLNMFGTLFFFFWYSLMLRSTKLIAVAMLVFRGYGIVSGSVSILSMSFYLPFPLIFLLVLAVVMEFVEAVFCIYVLFNPVAANTIKLNRSMDQVLAQNMVPKATLEQMAEYRNECEEEEETAEPADGKEKETGREQAGQREEERKKETE